MFPIIQMDEAIKKVGMGEGNQLRIPAFCPLIQEFVYHP